MKATSGAVASSGSSPLTRGKPQPWLIVTWSAGLIPAHAGKTGLAAYAGQLHEAHPRSRGENSAWTDPLARGWGSSPLTRGKLLRSLLRLGRHGLIPAHAGKTGLRRASRRSPRAHPRSRGENRVKTPTLRGRRAHPRSRGENVLAAPMIVLIWWLIPAHAGKTPTVYPFCAWARAHPRSRGENSCAPPRTPPTRGSSPLTRGKLNRRWHGQGGHGLIPAHAGKTPISTGLQPSTKAHPRSRGENLFPHAAPRLRHGSSPLTRGKPGASPQSPPRRRLIPAHAGKTHHGRARRDLRRAHPRSRGENSESPFHESHLKGSSPLTRGKPRRALHGLRESGLIPAHAGKTR